MKIPRGQFRWYAAFRDEGHHPHVHIACYSADGKSGFLTKEGIAKIKAGLAKEIFQQDLTEIYQRQTQRRDELVQKSGEVMKTLIQEMRTGTLENPRIGMAVRAMNGMTMQPSKGVTPSPSFKGFITSVTQRRWSVCWAGNRGLSIPLRQSRRRNPKGNLPCRLPTGI